MERDRAREIKVLNLSRRIAAVVDSGAVDDVEMSDEQVARIAEVLCPERRSVVDVATPMAALLAVIQPFIITWRPVHHAVIALAC